MRSVRAWLDESKQKGLYRELAPESQALDFASNDYLGLSTHPEVRAAMIDALAGGLPLGSGGSRLLRGNRSIHQQTEQHLAETFEDESILLFGSAYAANLGMLVAVGGNDVEFFSDGYNHASLIDGMRLAEGKRTVFAHNDIADLAAGLSASTAERKVIVCESVYSMDGDLAPLRDYTALAREHGAWLVIDECHATGLMGKEGLGLARELPRGECETIVVHACGKALGAAGGFVQSSKAIRELMINRARSFIYSTAPSPVLCVQISTALRIACESVEARAACLDNAAYFRKSFPSAARSAIAPVILKGGNDRTAAVASRVQAAGYDVRAIRSPTVPAGSERLRVTLKSFHSREQMDGLIEAIEAAVAHG